MDPKTGNVSTKASLKGADDAILVAIEEARTGVFQPNRENDELTRALGHPKHPGRTRGKGAIPWYEGFSDWNTDYRTRARKKIAEEKKRKMEEEQRKRDYKRLQGLKASQAELVVKFQRQQEQIDSLTHQRGSQQLQQLRMIQHWIAPSHPCREAAWVPPRATQCWIDTPWMISWRTLTASYI